MNNLRYYLGFNLVYGIGPTRLGRLVERCGTLEAAWSANHHDIAAAGIDARSSETFLTTRSKIDLDTELEKVERAGVQLVCIEDPAYPPLLAHAPAAPPLLYVRGSLAPSDTWMLAVVGTRAPTGYGKDMARRLVDDLARAGITIVSGLALGIDAVAHAAALEAGGRTIAVLAHGVDMAYPERNARLADQICERGALISDYPIGARPVPANFPPRNRIISGMSRGVLVVEAPEHSGALITVAYALEQGRDVFAVPGQLFSRASAGTNRMIADGAAIVLGAQTILESLNLDAAAAQQEATAAVPDNPTEATLLDLISAEPRHIDALGHASGLPAASVLAALSLMELKGMVRHIGGMHYISSRP